MAQVGSTDSVVRRLRVDAWASLAQNGALAVLVFAGVVWVKLHGGEEGAPSLSSALASSVTVSLPLVVIVVRLLWPGTPRRVALAVRDLQPATVVSQTGRHLVLDVGRSRVDVRVESIRGRHLAVGEQVWVPRDGRRPQLVVLREPGRFGRHTLWAVGR